MWSLLPFFKSILGISELCLRQSVNTHISSHSLVEIGLIAVSLLFTSIADIGVSCSILAWLKRAVRIDLSFIEGKLDSA